MRLIEQNNHKISLVIRLYTTLQVICHEEMHTVPHVHKILDWNMYYL